MSAFAPLVGAKRTVRPQGRTPLLDDMVARYGAFAGSPEAGHVAAIKQLWQLTYREASTLAYAEAFRFIMIAFVIATLLVPLLLAQRRADRPRVVAGTLRL
jgi:DHA2 family multidrug resistance protein